MIPELTSIRKKRILLGLTQKELARETGISQSFIAKMESGKINPSYGHVKKIVNLLEKLENSSREEMRARQFCRKRVISLDADDRISHAVELMRAHNISQLPVFRGKVPTGSVTERGIVDLLSRGYDSGKLSSMKVSEIMEEPFPVINGDMPLSVISSLLQHNQAVLLSMEGEICGIITKADIIKLVRQP